MAQRRKYTPPEWDAQVEPESEPATEPEPVPVPRKRTGPVVLTKAGSPDRELVAHPPLEWWLRHGWTVKE